MFKTALAYILAALLCLSVLPLTACSPEGQAPASSTTASPSSSAEPQATQGNQSDLPAQPSGPQERLLQWVLPPSDETWLNPFLSTNPDLFPLNLLFERLFSFRADGSLLPGLVQSYTFEKDGELRLELKPGLCWSDDQPLTSQDLLFSLQQLAKLPANHPWYPLKDRLISVTAESDTQLLLRYRGSPFILMKALGNVRPVPKHIWHRAPLADWNKQSRDLRRLVGSGAFYLQQTLSNGCILAPRIKLTPTAPTRERSLSTPPNETVSTADEADREAAVAVHRVDRIDELLNRACYERHWSIVPAIRVRYLSAEQFQAAGHDGTALPDVYDLRNSQTLATQSLDQLQLPEGYAMSATQPLLRYNLRFNLKDQALWRSDIVRQSLLDALYWEEPQESLAPWSLTPVNGFMTFLDAASPQHARAQRLKRDRYQIQRVLADSKSNPSGGTPILKLLIRNNRPLDAALAKLIQARFKELDLPLSIEAMPDEHYLKNLEIPSRIYDLVLVADEMSRPYDRLLAHLVRAETLTSEKQNYPYWPRPASLQGPTGQHLDSLFIAAEEADNMDTALNKLLKLQSTLQTLAPALPLFDLHGRAFLRLSN